MTNPMKRCWWCGDDPLYQAYHDQEWGFPVTDDRRLFEKLSLESFQSGLSWITILRKRDNFRAAFDNFNAAKIAHYDTDKIESLLQDTGIIRHRGKIESVINNAPIFLSLQQEFGSFSNYVWQFKPATHAPPKTIKEAKPRTESPESRALSKDLKKHGWKFLGPTTAYAFIQAMGLVNDHLADCHCQQKIAGENQAHS